jgi:3-hydroxyisobutyrate dehydrogenase
MGEAGMGQHAKMANQIAIAGQLIGLAEALSYATEKNLDLKQVLAILSTGAAQSYSVTHYGPKMLVKDWSATFYLKHFLKDLSIAVASSVQPLPMVEQVKKTLLSLVNRYGEQGVQSIIQAYLT